MTRFVAFCTALTFAIAAPAAADVKITSTNSGKGMGGLVNGDSVQYLKGSKMRVDSKVGSDPVSTVYDLDQQKMIVINHKKKEAEIHDVRKMAANLKKVSESDINVQVKPNGQTKQLLGQTCDGYDVLIRVRFSPVPDQPMTIAMGGPAWLAKNAPGHAEMAAFYNAAIEKGFIFSDPQVVQAQPGQARGVAALYKAMADAGIAYSTEIQIKFEGEGMMAAMMNKMGSSSINTLVTAVSTETVGDDVFAIPAGYKSRER